MTRINKVALLVAILTLSPAAKAIKFSVGHGNWEFPSDHLPRGARVKLKDELGKVDAVRVATFNVLNSIFKELFIGNEGQPPTDARGGGQQLAGTRLHKMPEAERNKENIHVIAEELLRKRDFGVVVLQEVTSSFLNQLREALAGTKFEISQTKNPKSDDYGVIIWDTERFKLIETLASATYEAKEGESKYMQALILQHRGGERFTVVNTHMELGHSERLSHFLDKLTPPILAMGDLNTAEPKIPGFTLLHVSDPGVYTHVNTKRKSVTYDHILSKGLEVVSDDLTEQLVNFSGPY